MGEAGGAVFRVQRFCTPIFGSFIVDTGQSGCLQPYCFFATLYQAKCLPLYAWTGVSSDQVQVELTNDGRPSCVECPKQAAVLLSQAKH